MWSTFRHRCVGIQYGEATFRNMFMNCDLIFALDHSSLQCYYLMFKWDMNWPAWERLSSSHDASTGIASTRKEHERNERCTATLAAFRKSFTKLLPRFVLRRSSPLWWFAMIEPFRPSPSDLSKSLIRVSQTDPLSELTTFDNKLVLSLTFKATF